MTSTDLRMWVSIEGVFVGGKTFLSAALILAVLLASCAKEESESETEGTRNGSAASGSSSASAPPVPPHFKVNSPEILIAGGQEGVNPADLVDGVRVVWVLMWSGGVWVVKSAAEAYALGAKEVWPHSGGFGSAGHAQAPARRAEQRAAAAQRAQEQKNRNLYYLKGYKWKKVGASLVPVGPKKGPAVISIHNDYQTCDWELRAKYTPKVPSDVYVKYLDFYYALCACVSASGERM